MTRYTTACRWKRPISHSRRWCWFLEADEHAHRVFHSTTGGWFRQLYSSKSHPHTQSSDRAVWTWWSGGSTVEISGRVTTQRASRRSVFHSYHILSRVGAKDCQCQEGKILCRVRKGTKLMAQSPQACNRVSFRMIRVKIMIAMTIVMMTQKRQYTDFSTTTLSDKCTTGKEKSDQKQRFRHCRCLKRWRTKYKG